MKIIPGSNYNNTLPAFTAMKPNQFKGFDYACVRKFKAPVEKFNSLQDFNKWVMDRFRWIQDLEYRARDDEITIQRRGMIEEWAECLLRNITIPSACLIAIASITKNLKRDTDTLPPVLNKKLVNETFNDLKLHLEQNKDYQFNFSKIYQDNLKTEFDEQIKNKTGWIIMPSQIHDTENFEQNVYKLKTLSAKTWCTKNIQSELYLAEGDFHLYLENGKTKYCLRFQGDSIIEIQNELNNTKIDYPCFKEIYKYIIENQLSITGMAKVKFDDAQTKFKNINKIENLLHAAIKNNNTKEILTLLDFKPEELTDGTLSIEEYNQPSEFFTFSDLGIDENRLLNCISEIRGDAILEDSSAQSLGNVRYIGGDLDCCNSHLISTGELEKIGGELNLNNSHIKSTGKIKVIGGNAHFERSYITNLNNIETVGGNLYLNPNTTTLGKLKTIGRDVSFNVKHLSLGDLEKIGGDAYVGEGVTSLGALKEVGGEIDLTDSQITNTGNLEIVNGYVYISPESPLTKECFDNVLTRNIIEVESYAF